MNAAASMGPRAFARGDRSRSSPRRHRLRWLQWGRELSPAEIARRTADAVPFLRCFNGAASFRPRRYENFNTDRTTAKSFNGAASFRPRRSITTKGIMAAAQVASMGPRAFARGDRTQSTAPRFGPVRFNGAASFRPRRSDPPKLASPQPTEAAEMKLPLPALENKGWLQWGRELSPAEMLGVEAATWRVEYASMGPRAFARGDLPKAPAAAPAPVASMGPRAFARGDTQVRAGSVVRNEVASMGPRAFARGDVEGSESGAVQRRPSFNGAASFRPRRYASHGPQNPKGSRFNGAASFRPRRLDALKRLAARDLKASMGPRAFARGDAFFASS